MEIKPFGWPGDMPFKTRPETRFLVVHHLAGPDQSARQVDAQERWDFGWLAIGYHLVIRKDGSLEEGRPLWSVGAQALNHNFESVGVCLTGNFMEETPTPEQLESLAWVLKGWQARFPGALLKPHRDLSATLCPGKLFPWEELLARLAAEDLPANIQDWAKDAVRKAVDLGVIDTPQDLTESEQKQLVVLDRLKLLK